ncbi:MAG: hypothetical protein IOC64_05755 [Methylobacterium sp.]|nr:hypothetical protein [Methylobacterium sp.]MCA3607926.1 hypothetical protein [Methylobacterium sp.]MCA3617305.1 hypothetical protein [Methylobacterium sp.]MCA3620821.1 hypothetical protein [Methylobacterium sp.]
MREEKSGPGLGSSFFLPVFVGAICGWVFPYMIFAAPVSGSRFLDGAIGLVLCGLIGGVVGAMRRKLNGN